MLCLHVYSMLSDEFESKVAYTTIKSILVCFVFMCILR